MLRKHVKNWHSVIPIFLNLSRSATIVFRDGTTLLLTSKNYHDFYEKIYGLHCRSNGLVYVTEEGYQVVNLPNGFSLRLMDAQYSHVLDEVFVERVYDFVDLESKIAIDVGASIGDTAIHFASQGAMVFAFEPDNQRFKNAIYNIAKNDLQDKVKIYNKYVNSCKEIAEICSAYEDKEVFLKLDCEGCERQILLDKLPSNIEACAMEYHGPRNFLINSLNKQGFKSTVRNEIIFAKRSRKID